MGNSAREENARKVEVIKLVRTVGFTGRQLDADIKSYFDNITQDKLIDEVDIEVSNGSMLKHCQMVDASLDLKWWKQLICFTLKMKHKP